MQLKEVCKKCQCYNCKKIMSGGCAKCGTGVCIGGGPKDCKDYE